MKSARGADLVLAAAGTAFAVVVLYAAWHHERYFVGWMRILCYYLVPLGLAAALFLSLRLSTDRKLKLSVLVVTSFLCLYGLEAFARIWSAQALVRRAAREGNVADERSILDVVRDLRAKGTDAFPCVYPAEMVKQWLGSPEAYPLRIDDRDVLPLGAISRKPTVLCNESGQYMIYLADEHGFHNPLGSWSAGPHRVAAVGDSFAQGYCVPSEAGPVARLRDVFPGTLNLGMQANGPLLELAGVREFLPTIEPEVVLWFYFEGNDLAVDLQLERQHPLLRRYVEDPGYRQGLAALQTQVDDGLRGFAQAYLRHEPEAGESASLAELVGFVKFDRLRSVLGLTLGGAQVDFALFRETLRQAERTVKSWGGTLYVVYLPERSRYQGSLLRRNDPLRAGVLRIVDELAIPLIDIHETFSKDERPLRFFAGYHYNEEGYALVSREVLEVIRGQLDHR